MQAKHTSLLQPTHIHLDFRQTRNCTDYPSERPETLATVVPTPKTPTHYCSPTIYDILYYIYHYLENP
jgi:hypothetical protein